MIINRLKEQFEKGQALPIIVFGVLTIIIFSALLIDGGAIMLNKRTAQVAADAGAMAGAREFCYKTGADPLTVARNYAEMNGATIANAEYSGGLVQVTTTVYHNSFFARIPPLNEDILSASAEARAGCFPPDAGEYIMPVAWSCRPPIGEGPWDFDLGCKMMALDWNYVGDLIKGPTTRLQIPAGSGEWYRMQGHNIVHEETGEPPPEIYIVMDKISVNQETICKEDLEEDDELYNTAIVCDLNGDGKNDIEGAGNRGWLDLDGQGGGANELRDWIKNGVDFEVKPHTWLSGQPGTTNSVYQDVRDYRVGDIVLIPVFNAICDDKDPIDNPACMEAAHSDPWPEEPDSGDYDPGGSAPKFHVIAFDAFYISCVRTKSNDYCPGFALAQKLNPDPKHSHKSLIPDNVEVIEGYFLKNVEFLLNPDALCDINLGNCVVSLVD